jgi:signal transduction histidine kinase
MDIDQKNEKQNEKTIYYNTVKDGILKKEICLTLNDLNLFSTSIEVTQNVSKLAAVFETDLVTPGSVLLFKGQFIGMLSRRKFLEYMSRPYSLELYNKRPITYLIDNNKQDIPLILSGTTTIAEATHKSLQRSVDNLYEPVIIKTEDGTYKLLDSHQLLLMQSEIHRLTVESLREANEFKSEILSIASHDLKNPLNSILGFSSMIKDDPKAEQTIRDMASFIHHGANGMLALIIKLLDSATAEQGQITLEKADVDLSLLITEVIKENYRQTVEKDQSVIFNLKSDENYIVQCDRQRIHEVVDNLISNAIKYSQHGKTITVELAKKNCTISCSVKDEGPGIRQEEMGKLFGKFQRLSARPTAGESSTGLGLYIVKQTVELHGGHVFAESVLGMGSTFIFELPE